MKTRRQQRAHDRQMQELAEFRARADAAKARLDQITDPEELADASRDWMLANADHLEAWSITPGNAAMWRRRANSESYRRTFALFTLAERLKKSADAAHALTLAESRAQEAAYRANDLLLRATIDAMIRGHR